MRTNPVTLSDSDLEYGSRGCLSAAKEWKAVPSKEYDALLTTLDAIKAERDRAVEALRFYADESTYREQDCDHPSCAGPHRGTPVAWDNGAKARTALARIDAALGGKS